MVKTEPARAPHGLTAALALVLALAGHFSAPVLLAAEVVQPTQPDSRLALVVTARSTRVEVLGERSQSIVVPAGARLSTIAPRGDAWVTAGVWRHQNRTTLLLITNEGGIVRRWPSPRQVSASILAFPTLLTDGAGTLSLAWLQGDDPRSTRLRTATWEGDRWSAPTTVAGIAPGSQTALRGTTLADGSSLLVWSRFDGRDDEIYWSSNAGGRWSSPRPVAADNAVPDVIPAVVAAGNGAVAAWSRYDGNDYRLVVARFLDGIWTVPQEIGGPGSLYPSFTLQEGRPHLLFEESAASAWSVVRLDSDGLARRRVTLVTDDDDRPLVFHVDDAEAILRWPRSGRQLRQDWSFLP